LLIPRWQAIQLLAWLKLRILAKSKGNQSTKNLAPGHAVDFAGHVAPFSKKANKEMFIRLNEFN
jgi:hypothetical protein